MHGENVELGSLLAKLKKRDLLIIDLIDLTCPSESRADALNIKITGLADDSRRVQPGFLFVAIPGNKHDGHDYIPAALLRGAAAIVGERKPQELAETALRVLLDENICYIQVRDARRALALLAAHFFAFPTEKLFTVGVTGTKGKTTVAHLTAELLGPGATELISTVTNNLQRGIVNTTPGALRLQQIAAEALRKNKENLVIEVSAHALSQQRVAEIDFDVAVFTNLSHDHLDHYRDLDDYFRAKLRLFAELKGSGTAVVNRDDPRAAEIAQATKATVLYYSLGLRPDADIYAERVQTDLSGSRFLLRTPLGKARVLLPLPGEFNIYNALAAAGVALARGVKLNIIIKRLEGVKPVPGRFERYHARGGFDIVIDFAHSPDALEKMIKALKPYYRRVLTVFGCGGESDRAKRPLMGRISGMLSDYTIITSDNPKSERPEEIIAEIEAGIKSLGASYEAIVSREAAIRRAVALARPGDIILIAGKGHERTQVFADHEREFNDQEFLKREGLI